MFIEMMLVWVFELTNDLEIGYFYWVVITINEQRNDCWTEEYNV